MQLMHNLLFQKEETKDTKKKKKKVKVIDLPIAAQVAEISKVELNKYIEQEVNNNCHFQAV